MTLSSDTVQRLGFVQTLREQWDGHASTTVFLIKWRIIVIGMMPKKKIKFHEMTRRQWAKLNQTTL